MDNEPEEAFDRLVNRSRDAALKEIRNELLMSDILNIQSLKDEISVIKNNMTNLAGILLATRANVLTDRCRLDFPINAPPVEVSAQTANEINNVLTEEVLRLAGAMSSISARPFQEYVTWNGRVRNRLASWLPHDALDMYFPDESHFAV